MCFAILKSDVEPYEFRGNDIIISGVGSQKRRRGHSAPGILRGCSLEMPSRAPPCAIGSLDRNPRLCTQFRLSALQRIRAVIVIVSQQRLRAPRFIVVDLSKTVNGNPMNSRSRCLISFFNYQARGHVNTYPDSELPLSAILTASLP